LLPESLDPYLLTDAATQRRINHPANLAAVCTCLAEVLQMDQPALQARLESNHLTLWKYLLPHQPLDQSAGPEIP
jgi:Tat protein secretion system quality control protein TatD with DNase activity